MLVGVLVVVVMVVLLVVLLVVVAVLVRLLVVVLGKLVVLVQASSRGHLLRFHICRLEPERITARTFYKIRLLIMLISHNLTNLIPLEAPNLRLTSTSWREAHLVTNGWSHLVVMVVSSDGRYKVTLLIMRNEGVFLR